MFMQDTLRFIMMWCLSLGRAGGDRGGGGGSLPIYGIRMCMPNGPFSALLDV